MEFSNRWHMGAVDSGNTEVLHYKSDLNTSPSCSEHVKECERLWSVVLSNTVLKMHLLSIYPSDFHFHINNTDNIMVCCCCCCLCCLFVLREWGNNFFFLREMFHCLLMTLCCGLLVPDQRKMQKEFTKFGKLIDQLSKQKLKQKHPGAVQCHAEFL